MNNSDTKVNCGCSTLFIVLILLKLAGVLSISWWWLLGPALFITFLGTLVGVVALVVYAIGAAFEK